MEKPPKPSSIVWKLFPFPPALPHGVSFNEITSLFHFLLSHLVSIPPPPGLRNSQWRKQGRPVFPLFALPTPPLGRYRDNKGNQRKAPYAAKEALIDVKKWRVDLLLVDPSTLKLQRVPAWEWDGKQVKELDYRAFDFRSVTWEKTYTEKDGMDFLNVLHNAVGGTFFAASEPYEVEDDGA